MNNKVPKVFVNNIKKINNNKTVFYSYKEKVEEKETYLSELEIQNKINNIFKAKDFVYKKRIFIKTKYEEGYFTIISKNIEYLLTLEGKRIYIKDILKID